MTNTQVKEQLMELLKNDPDVEAQIREKVAEAKADHESPAVKDLKREMVAWVKQATKDTSVNWGTLQNGLYSVLRTKLKLRSVNGLAESQVPEARQIFEQYKTLF